MCYDVGMLMNLSPEYYPYLTGGLIIITVLILIRGFHRGILFQLIDLATLLVSVFLAWPIARALAGLVPLFSPSVLTSWQTFLLNQVCWFVITVLAVKVIFSLLYLAAGLLKKIKVFGFLDRLAGLVLAAVTAYIGLGLFGLFLQLPFIENGEKYVESTPLKYPVETTDRVLDVLSKGDVSFDAIREAISK